MKFRLLKTFLVSLLLGVAGTYLQAGELYPWQLTRDSLLLFEGTTYRYTVAVSYTHLTLPTTERV